MRRNAVVLAIVWATIAGAVPARAQAPQEAASASATQPPVEPRPETLLQALRKMHVTAGTDILGTSAYIWRGFVPTDAFSLQPNSWIKAGGLTLSSWSNMAGRNAGGFLTEHDFTLDYSKSAGRLTMSAGWINYVFPPAETGRHSNELYVGMAHASYLNPAVRVYQDVHAGKGSYLNVAIAHEYPVGRVAVTPNATLGYNHHQWIDRSTFSDAAFGVKVKIPTPIRRLSISPFVTYSQTLAADIFPSRLYGGLGISVQ